MKYRIYAMLLALALALCCVACGAGESEQLPEQETEKGAVGVLTEEELKAYEALYEKSQEETLAALGLREEDAAQVDVVSAVFEDAREIAGEMFLCVLNFSEAEYYQGFYGVDFRAAFPSDQEGLLETVQAIHQDALAQYGTPTTYEGLGEILTAQLEAGEVTGVEDWKVGSQSTLRIQVTDTGDLVVIQLHYQIDPQNLAGEN